MKCCWAIIPFAVNKWFKKLLYRFRYLSRPPWDSGISPPELLQFLTQTPPGRALDLGCGSGTNVITLAQHGWQATGIDFVPAAIRSARRKARISAAAVNFIMADVTDPSNFSGLYDLVLDMGCYHSLSQSQREDYRRNLLQILAPGGTYLLYAFTGQKQGPARSIITEQDLNAFQQFLFLKRRQDGSERGLFSSSWFWYQNLIEVQTSTGHSATDQSLGC